MALRRTWSIFLLAASAIALASYQVGKERGRHAEQERAFRKEAIAAGAPLASAEEKNHPPGEVVFAQDSDGQPSAAIYLEPFDCIRVVWPMEIIAASADMPQPHLRLREGANRFAQPGAGVAEFAFVTRQPAAVTIYLHFRCADECSNSILCRIDSGAFTFMDMQPPYGVWRWQPLYRRFYLQPGMHRLSLMASEDGVEIDRIMLTTQMLRKPDEIRRLSEEAVHRKPPFFENLTMTSPFFPAIGPISAQAFANHSLVIGAGHRNTVAVYLRLNAKRETSGTVRISSERDSIEVSRPFALSPLKRSDWLEIPVSFQAGSAVTVPVLVEVFADNTLVHAQRLNFIRPLAWAFLGPFTDPENKGIEAALPPDTMIASLHTLPALADCQWRKVADGSCYDEFGVIDLNQVFGFPRKADKQRPPLVAYAVTCVPQWFPNPHQSLAYGGDDAVRVWLNGRELARADTGCPLEMNRWTLGTALSAGCNAFVFKISQREGYWQLVFEPEWRTPYGMQDFLQVLPFERWQRENPLWRFLRPFSPLADN